MFAPKAAAPSTGGLSINTNSANSLFGANPQTTSTSTAASGTTGSLFGNANSTAQSKPAGGLFGNTQSAQPTGSNMFSGLGQTPTGATGGGIFGGAPTTTTTQAQPSSLFGGGATAAGAGTGTGTAQAGTGSLFGGGLGATSTAQTQQKPALGLGGLGGGLGTTTGGAFGNTQNTQLQSQQPQKPSLGLFANTSTAQQPLQQSTATGNVVPGVKVDLTNLLPTTKYESCADELRREIENIDNAILEQIRMCNEVADILPTIEQQGSTIPNDVEFVQGKLDTIQHALENDASDIDQLRGLVTRDAAEAQVAFRAIDTLKLPMQYQSSGGGGWWSVHDQKVPDRGSLRSTRKNTLALPDDVEVDPSTANTVNGVPVNLVDYFSQRSDEMGAVLGRYKGNLKEIEDHLHGVEVNLNRQIHDFVSSRSRDGSGAGTPKSAVNDLAAVLGDVEAGIMGVAARLGGVTEQVQEVSLGPLGLGDRM